MNLNTAFDQIGDYARSYVDKLRLPGIAIGITDREKLLHTFYYGYADLATKRSITADTRFYVASIGKSFTSLTLLQLVASQGIDLHAPAQRYLPWFRAGAGSDDFTEEITLHHLLTHTSGIQQGTDFAPSSPYEIYALRNAKARIAPGKIFHYSNVGYKLLGYVLEHLAGVPYHRLLNQAVLAPLGMTQSFSCVTRALRDVMAIGYETCFDDRPYFLEYPLEPAPRLELNTGDGCVVTTVTDLCKFVQMVLNRGDTPNGRFISAESIDLMLTPQIDRAFDNDSLSYGYGVTIEKGRQFGHGGDAPGFKSCYMADIESGLGVVVVSNGPLLTTNVAYFALESIQAVRNDSPLPDLPRFDPTHFPEDAAYEGTYVCNDQSFTLRGRDAQLIFSYKEDQFAVRRRGPDRFFIEHPDFSIFLLEAIQEQGEVVGFQYGSQLYAKERREITTSIPAGWDALAGHYGAYNPWLSNFRIVFRERELLLIEPQGVSYRLAATDTPYLFDVFKGETRLPEWVEFDRPVDTQTLKLNYSGCDYYRLFTH